MAGVDQSLAGLPNYTDTVTNVSLFGKTVCHPKGRDNKCVLKPIADCGLVALILPLKSRFKFPLSSLAFCLRFLLKAPTAMKREREGRGGCVYRSSHDEQSSVKTMFEAQCACTPLMLTVPRVSPRLDPQTCNGRARRPCHTTTQTEPSHRPPTHPNFARPLSIHLMKNTMHRPSVDPHGLPPWVGPFRFRQTTAPAGSSPSTGSPKLRPPRLPVDQS